MNAHNHKVLTLAFLHEGDKILLGMKKRGFGAGKWNGFGGKVGSGETIEEACGRELFEEVGVHARDFEKAGICTFHYEHTGVSMDVHIFRVITWEGAISESEEMEPQWFQIASIPFEQMWLDDPCWFPHYLAKEYFEAEFWFSDYDTMSRHEVKRNDLMKV